MIRFNRENIWLLLLLLCISNSIYSQIDYGLQKRVKIPDFNTDVSVPEIDPRQFVIIYDWKEANENKNRGVVNSSVLIKPYLKQDSILREKTIQYRNKSDSLSNELQSIYSNIGKSDSIISKIIEELNTVNLVYDSTTSEYLGYDKYDSLDIELNRFHDIKNHNEEQSININNSKKIVDESLTELITDRNKIQPIIKSWDHSRITSYPYDYFEDSPKGNEILTPNKIAYDHFKWQNGGINQLEPIWWLNRYKWPKDSYRNVDQDSNQKDFLLPFQKYSVVDHRAKLRIVFDKSLLANNQDFKGSMSIEAYLYDGESENSDPRPIEVNPYSTIGKEKKAIGLLNRPAGELSDNLIQLIVKGKEFSRKANPILGSKHEETFTLYEKRILAFTKNLQNTLTTDEKGLSEIQKLVSENDSIYLHKTQQRLGNIVTNENFHYRIKSAIDRQQKNKFNSIHESATILCNEIRYNSLLNLNKETPLRNQYTNDLDCNLIDLYLKLKDVPALINLVDTFVKKGEQSNGTSSLSYLQSKTRSYQELAELMSLLVNYLSYFDEEIGETQKAFLKLIAKDKISFQHIIEESTRANRNINLLLDELKSDTSKYNNGNQLKLMLSKMTAEFQIFERYIHELSDIQGSPISPVLHELGYDDNLKPKKKNMVHPQSIYTFEDTAISKESNSTILDSTEHRQTLRNYIARKAGEVLYQNLIYATIDLDQADATDGDQLYIKLKWDKDLLSLDLKSDDNTPVEKEENGIELYVAKFEIKRTGWSRNISENSVLVKRLGENLLRSDYPLSPTNFGLTGGISVMWTYKNNHRINKKIKFDKNTNLPLFNKNGELRHNSLSVATQKFLNWLEPSIGFSINYLDYRTDDGFELGIGPTIGLFDNLIYLTGGINLMELDEQPTYFGLGLSFINLGNKIKEFTENNSKP